MGNLTDVKKIYAVNVNESFVMIQHKNGLIKKYPALLRKKDNERDISLYWCGNNRVYVSKRYMDYQEKLPKIKENGFLLSQYKEEMKNKFSILVYSKGRNYGSYRGQGHLNELRVIEIENGKIIKVSDFSQNTYASQWCMGDFLPAKEDNEEFIIPEGIKLSLSYYVPYDGTGSYWENPAIFSGKKKDANFFFKNPKEILDFVGIKIEGDLNEILLR